ncbi:hypothetical protein GCM10009534_62840 [Kribbella sandramycini]
MPQQQPYPGPPPAFHQQAPQPPRRKSRTLMIVAGAVALVLVASVGGALVWKNLSGDEPAATGAPPAGAKIIEPGQPVTAQTLSEVHPQAFVESFLKRQMVAPIGQLKTIRFENPEKFLEKKDYSITDYAVDHRTNKFSLEYTGFSGTGTTDRKCIDGKSMMYIDGEGLGWQEDKGDDDCTRQPFFTVDGIVSSGLTAEQADRVLAYFHQEGDGYLNAAQPTLLTTGGRTYIRQVVDFKTIIRDDQPYGTAVSQFAFRDCGHNRDSARWFWATPFNLAAGLHMVYYLDTKTLLPVAAYQASVPAAGSYPDKTVQLVNYAFPAAVPQVKQPKGPGTLTFNLPEGWKTR